MATITAKDMRVLVVDDAINARASVVPTLQACGYHVSSMADGESAMATLKAYSHTFHIVLTDITTSNGLSALQLLQLVRSTPSLANLVFVVCSDDQEPDTCIRYLKEGADLCLTKPVVPKEVALLWQQVVLRREHTTPVVSAKPTQELLTELNKVNGIAVQGGGASMVPQQRRASERSSSSSACSAEMMGPTGGNGNGGDRRSVPQPPVDLSQNVALPGSRLGQTPPTATGLWQVATTAAEGAAAAVPASSEMGVARPSKPLPRPRSQPETSWQTTDLNRLWCPTSLHVENQVDDPSPQRSIQQRSTLCTPETAAQTAKVHREASSGRKSVRAWLEETAAATTTTEEQQTQQTVFWAVLEGLQLARSNGELRMPLYPSALLLHNADADRPLRVTVDARLKPNRSEAVWYCPEPASTSPSEADAFTLGALLFEMCFTAGMATHDRDAAMRQLAAGSALPAAAAASQPQAAARVHWLTRSRPPLHLVAASQLFRMEAASLPEPARVSAKHVHTEVLGDFLGEVLAREEEDHQRLLWETQELTMDIHIVQKQLDTLRMARTSMDSRRSESIDRRQTSPSMERGSPAREPRRSLRQVEEDKDLAMYDEDDDNELFFARSNSGGSARGSKLGDGPTAAGGDGQPLQLSRLKRSASDRTVDDPEEELGEVRCSVDGGRKSCELMGPSERVIRAKQRISHDQRRFEEVFFRMRSSMDGSGAGAASMSRCSLDLSKSGERQKIAASEHRRSSSWTARGVDRPRTARASSFTVRMGAGAGLQAASGGDGDGGGGGDPSMLSPMLQQMLSEQLSGAQAARTAQGVAAVAVQGADARVVGQIEQEELETERAQRLNAFGHKLCSFARFSELSVVATLTNSTNPTREDTVCSTGFDRDDEFFATVGVSKRIKVFEYAKAIDPDIDVHCPVLEMTSRAKLSSVCWSSYIKQHLASSDYEGTVTLWDASTATPLIDFEEHRKRAWTVDISPKDPKRILSGSDDGTVKLWDTAQEGSVATIHGKANVCCVHFSPHNKHLVAFGSADYKSYVYDVRSLKMPLWVLCCHSKTVSYVRFQGSHHLVSASTDNTIKLWDLSASSTASAAVVGTQLPPQRPLTPAPELTYSGHVNEKNFVGLSISDSGYIACGSEDNSVYVYHNSLPWPTTKLRFDGLRTPAAPPRAADGGPPPPPAREKKFVSTVCWKRQGNALLAANSSGQIKILALK